MKRLSSSHITHRCSVSVGLLIHKMLRPVRFVTTNNALFFIILYTDYKYIKYFLLKLSIPYGNYLACFSFLFCFVLKIHPVYQLIKLNC